MTAVRTVFVTVLTMAAASTAMEVDERNQRCSQGCHAIIVADARASAAWAITMRSAKARKAKAGSTSPAPPAKQLPQSAEQADQSESPNTGNAASFSGRALLPAPLNADEEPESQRQTEVEKRSQRTACYNFSANE